MTDAAAIFNLKDHRLGKLVAAAISLVVTLFCLAFAFVGSAVLLREANSIEHEHDMVKSEYWVKQIAEAAFLGNMAYIEGNIRPGIEEQSQLAIFYVADPTGKIIVTSNLQFLDQDKEIASTFFSEVKSILKTHKIIREGSNLSLNIASRELKLASPLQRNAFARPVQQGDQILLIDFDVRSDAGPICTIAFGYNLGPMIQSLNRARSIILFSALITAAFLGLATLFITTTLLRPLEVISERLSGFSTHSRGFDESLGQFSLSGIKANSREVFNLLNAFTAFKQELRRNIAEMAELRTTAAVAQTTQMLAHDLRKPFGLLKIGLNMLSQAKDPDTVQRTLKKIVPEIDRAASNVNALLGDLLEIGTKSESIMRTRMSVYSAVESATYEAFMLFPKADIAVSYEFKHTKMLDADATRLQRVFSNILHNSIQAMKQKGRMWIQTRDTHGGKYIEFILGNSGPVIPKDSVPHLFEMFFTQNKAGGTGLGLAIVRKIIVAHGGEIYCRSSEGGTPEDRSTEFVFTLPACSEADTATHADLPTHSTMFQTNVTSILAQGDTWGLLDDPFSLAEGQIETELVSLIKELGHELRVAIVDDEPIYHNHLATTIQRSQDVAPLIAVELFMSPDEALAKLRTATFHLVISDIDYGAGEKDGYCFVNEIRELKGIRQPLICMHSNRISSADHRTSVEIGADAFLPKPMPKSHLLKLLLQAARHAMPRTG